MRARQRHRTARNTGLIVSCTGRRNSAAGAIQETALGLTPDQCAFQAIRGPRFKYVHFTTLPPLLFDLETDPAETRNLADDPAHAATALEIARRLLSWRLLHEDRTLANTAATPDGLVHWRGARV